MGVVVFLALGLGDLDVLRLGAQPATARGPVPPSNGAVLEVAAVSGRGLGDVGVDFPVGCISVVVDAGQHHFTGGALVLPAAGIACPHRHVPHGVSGIDVHVQVHHAYIGHAIVGVLREIRRGLGRGNGVAVAAVVHREGLGFQQRTRVGELVLLPLVGVVRRQPVLEAGAAAKQVETVLLVLGDGGLHEFLAFGPHVAQAGARQVLLGTGQAGGAGGLGINDTAEAVVTTHGLHQVRVINFARDARSIHRVLGLGLVVAHAVNNARRVDDGDLAFAVLGGVDAVDDELVVAVVGDVDTGIAVGRLDHAAAGAQNLAGQDHAAPFGHHVFHHDGLLGRIEIGLDRNCLGAEAHAR